MKTAHDLVMAAKTRTQEVALTDADEAIRDADVLIDVREADEFASGHLPDARNLPLAKLGERAGEVEKLKGKPVIVCCASGMRSAKACKELATLGFTNVQNLAGGVDAWVGAGYPLKKGSRNK